MITAYLDSTSGKYIIRLENTPVIGAIKDVKVSPPKYEHAHNIRKSKVRELSLLSFQHRQKINETDGEEQNRYKESLEKITKELNELRDSSFIPINSGKPFNAKARIIGYATPGETSIYTHHNNCYIVEINFPKRKYKEQWEQIFGEKKIN